MKFLFVPAPFFWLNMMTGLFGKRYWALTTQQVLCIHSCDSASSSQHPWSHGHRSASMVPKYLLWPLATLWVSPLVMLPIISSKSLIWHFVPFCISLQVTEGTKNINTPKKWRNHRVIKIFQVFKLSTTLLSRQNYKAHKISFWYHLCPFQRTLYPLPKVSNIWLDRGCFLGFLLHLSCFPYTQLKHRSFHFPCLRGLPSLPPPPALPLSSLFFFLSLLHSLLSTLAYIEFLLYPKFLLAFFSPTCFFILSSAFQFQVFLCFNFRIRIYLTMKWPHKGRQSTEYLLGLCGRTCHFQSRFGWGRRGRNHCIKALSSWMYRCQKSLVQTNGNIKTVLDNEGKKTRNVWKNITETMVKRQHFRNWNQGLSYPSSYPFSLKDP